jgi:peptide-methionine (S)-S-oxide reductase
MSNAQQETAVLGGGCFWCTEAIFQKVKGIVSVTSGYAGGQRQNPNYDQVSTGVTGHAEVIKIEFDSDMISYPEVLDIFWHVHDPTTLNRQGADEGTQYRSVIFYTTETQKSQAEASLKAVQESGEFSEQIVTKIEKLDTFYTAEQYHQNFFESNPQQPYCQLVIEPKVKKFLEKYSKYIKS